MPYASGTQTSVIASQVELRKLLKRFGCSSTGSQEHPDREILMFARNGLTYKFEVRIPTTLSGVVRDKRYRPSTHGTLLEYEHARKMRALVAVVKAKLVAVEEGITSFQEEFLPATVTDNGQTVAERWGPQINAQAIEGKYPSALPQFASREA